MSSSRDEHPSVVQPAERTEHVRVEHVEQAEPLRTHRPAAALLELMSESLV